MPALALLVLLLAPTPREEGLVRAAAWLWAKQSEEGGWRSETYGLLRSGQSLTPFVLRALLEVPESLVERDPVRVARALAFLRARIDEEGALGRAEPLVEDYPTYATSLAISCFARARPEGWREEVARMARCLLRQQFAEVRGWLPGHPAHGGWGMGGPLRKFPHAGHVDLSTTRFALEALADCGGVPPEALDRARVFLARCRSLGGDPADRGGFFYSPVVLDANKAGRAGRTFRPYGTATADGILALLAAGLPADHPDVRASARWLAARHRVDRVPGIEVGTAERWEQALRFYYLAAAAEAFAATGTGPDGWQGDLVRSLLEAQRPDGSFANANPLGKEDDPLVATPLAVRALVAASPYAKSGADDAHPAGPPRERRRRVVGREDEVLPLLFARQERRREVDRVERPDRRGERRRGAGEHRSRDLDDLHLAEEIEDRRPTDSGLLVAHGASEAEPVERPQALDLDEGARDGLFDLGPFLEPPRLPEQDPQHDRRVDVGLHR